ncbi:hypothetical protein BLNAU_17334 [Blattamonas nauphoetae]|uniref:Uncharacterized protein n=1 Tax=Blattamonas nauphoetae TaxID=2049346 RepID=A0ABQ9X7H1_9EUKA|nr:hypothetical protein BLNAU_17334 [Blattamonas nauphoetae]
MAASDANTNPSLDDTCTDCSPFLNWTEEELESEDEMARVFRSLVATVKFQPALDDSLEAKAVKLLESVSTSARSFADSFLGMFGRTTDDSSKNFVHSIVVLISTASHVINTTTMKMLSSLIGECSTRVLYPLVKADLFPQLIIILNPLSLSFTEAVDIHADLVKSISETVGLANPHFLKQLEIKDDDEQQAVHETVLKQVLAPSEQYIRHLCVNRYSIIEKVLSHLFLVFLARLLRICPYYQPTMEFIHHMPVVLTIPSYVTFYDVDYTIFQLFEVLRCSLEQWNEQGRYVGRSGTTIIRSLRMEGIEDVTEKKLHSDKKSPPGEWVVDSSIRWNNKLGMNITEQNSESSRRRRIKPNFLRFPVTHFRPN